MADIVRDLSKIQRSSRKYWDNRQITDDFRGSQHPIVMTICRHPGISQEELSQRTETHKSRIARQLSELEDTGYITRTVSPQDRRITQVWPTDKALSIVPEIDRLHDLWREKLTQGLSEEEKETLVTLLHRVRGNAEKACLPENEN